MSWPTGEEAVVVVLGVGLLGLEGLGRRAAAGEYKRRRRPALWKEMKRVEALMTRNW